MIDAYWYAGARDAHDGQSVYSRRAEAPGSASEIVREGVTCSPTRPTPGWSALRTSSRRRPATTTSVFDNGLPLGRTDWIATAGWRRCCRPGRPRRSPASRSPRRSTTWCSRWTAPPAGLDDLVAGTERGLLLTCLWYIRAVDPQTLLLTGLTRDGVYLVENGDITGAVNNFRFNESPIDLLRRFTAASATGPASAASGATTTSPAPPCPPCGSPTSTCRASPRPCSRPGSRGHSHAADRALGGDSSCC